MRKLLAGAVVGTLALCGPVLLAKPGVVLTVNGQRFEGDVTERADDVIITIRGVQTTLNRGDVSSIEYNGGFAADFADRLSRLAADDAKGRIELARWAMQQGQFESARDALESALAIDTNNAEATQLLGHARSQIRLQLQQGAAAGHGRSVGPAGSTTRPAEPASDGRRRASRVLSEGDIQAIRRAEWRTDRDDPVRVRIEVPLAKAYAESKQIKWSDFSRRRPVDQARALLTDGSPADRKAVTILSDPPSMAEFKRFVAPTILSGCATSNCHGGPNAGRFVLINPAENEAAVYSNFFLLDSYVKPATPAPAGSSAEQAAGSVFGGGAGELRMIERGKPSRSLLVQYGLPPDVAEYDHPKVANYDTPVFQSMNDPRLEPIVRWIERSLALNPASTGIVYTLTPTELGGSEPPATQPTTRRSSR